MLFMLYWLQIISTLILYFLRYLKTVEKEIQLWP